MQNTSMQIDFKPNSGYIYSIQIKPKDMDDETSVAYEICAVTSIIWKNFLRAPYKETTYKIQAQNDEKFIPDKDGQLGIINKIVRDGGISDLKENDDVLTFSIHIKEFSQFRKNFAHPERAFSDYRIDPFAPLPIPEGTKWEHVKIKFLNGHDVLITLKNDKEFKLPSNYKEMGFENSKTRLPNVQWKLLESLSDTGGSITWASPVASLKLKKRKQNLTEGLIRSFQISDDPFYPYKSEKSYEVKFKISH